jgi:hypothetical protein
MSSSSKKRKENNRNQEEELESKATKLNTDDENLNRSEISSVKKQIADVDVEIL